jgi:hypothetical protein
MIINAVMITEQLSLVDFQQKVKARGPDEFLRMRQRLVFASGRAYWQEVKELQIEDHVYAIQQAKAFDKAALEDYLGQIWGEDLPKHKPLWEFRLVTLEGEKTAIIFRTHHITGDGISYSSFLFNLLDQKDLDRPTLAGKPPALWQRLALTALGFPKLCWTDMLGPVTKSPFLGLTPKGERGVCWDVCATVDTVKQIKDKYDVSFNDVLLAALAGAFRSYSAERKIPTSDCTVAVPFSFRSKAPPGVIDNHFTLILVKLPVGTKDSLVRLQETARVTKKLKKSFDPIVRHTVQELLATSQAALLSEIIALSIDRHVAVVTNLPGPSVDVSINGSKVVDMLTWVPTVSKVGIGISFFTYAGSVKAGVNSDVAVMKEPRRMLQLLHEELQTLAATVLQSSKGSASTSGKSNGMHARQKSSAH